MILSLTIKSAISATRVLQIFCDAPRICTTKPEGPVAFPDFIMLIKPKVRHFVIKMEEATPNWTPTTTSAFIKHFFKINYKTCYLIHLYSGVPKYFWLKFELPPWTISFKLFLLRGISRPTKKWCWVATTTPEIIWMSVTTERQSFKNMWPI